MSNRKPTPEELAARKAADKAAARAALAAGPDLRAAIAGAFYADKRSLG